jgi:hypothetical protein
MNEMKYIGTNTGLNSNPAGLYVYRKGQHPENTTPAGVAQPMFVLQFYKHSMPLALENMIYQQQKILNQKSTAQKRIGKMDINR